MLLDPMKKFFRDLLELLLFIGIAWAAVHVAYHALAGKYPSLKL